MERAQDLRGAAHIVESEREEQLRGSSDAGRDERRELLVVAVRSRDRLGEDRRIGRRTADAELVDELGEVAALEQVARELVEPDRDAGRMQRSRRFMTSPVASTLADELLERNVRVGQPPGVDRSPRCGSAPGSAR